MLEIFTTNNIILSVLVVLLIFSLYINYNLMRKVEKYEDVVVDQTKYLQKVSNTIRETQQHLQNLDERGVFQSDDEVGEFFNQMKEVQNELNRFMLPKNYGKEKIQR